MAATSAFNSNNLEGLTQDFGAANTLISYSVALDTSNNVASQNLSIGGENMTFGQVAPAGEVAQNDAHFTVPGVA